MLTELVNCMNFFLFNLKIYLSVLLYMYISYQKCIMHELCAFTYKEPNVKYTPNKVVNKLAYKINKNVKN